MNGGFRGPGWPDARGWIGLGSYLLVVLVIVLIWADRSLLNNDFFKVIATAIVLTGWNGGPLSWAYAATKSGGELAERNAAIVEKQTDTANLPSASPATPAPVNLAQVGGHTLDPPTD